jgi:hypothetical protein
LDFNMHQKDYNEMIDLLFELKECHKKWFPVSSPPKCSSAREGVPKDTRVVYNTHSL